MGMPDPRPIAQVREMLLEHGDPKSARFFADEAHMGGLDAVAGVTVPWLAQQLHSLD